MGTQNQQYCRNLAQQLTNRTYSRLYSGCRKSNVLIIMDRTTQRPLSCISHSLIKEYRDAIIPEVVYKRLFNLSITRAGRANDLTDRYDRIFIHVCTRWTYPSTIREKTKNYNRTHSTDEMPHLKNVFRVKTLRSKLFRLQIAIENAASTCLPTLATVTACRMLGCVYMYIYVHLSRDMRFPTMWYVRPATAQTSLRIHAV